MNTSRRAVATALVALMLTLSACTAAGPASTRELDSSTASPASGDMGRQDPASGGVGRQAPASGGMGRQVPTGDGPVQDPDTPVSSPATGTAPGDVQVAPVPEPVLNERPVSGGGQGGGTSGNPGEEVHPVSGTVDAGNFLQVAARQLDERNVLVSGQARVWEGVFEVQVRVDGQVKANQQVTVAEGAPSFSPFEVRILLDEPLPAEGVEVCFVTQSPRDGSAQVELVTGVVRGE